MIVVGGTYTEVCYEPMWNHIYGSGLRGVHLLCELGYSDSLLFHTSCDEHETSLYLKYFNSSYKKLEIIKHQISKGFEFYYDHPLRDPIIIPSLENLTRNLIKIDESSEDILAFGMIESDFVLNGNRVVYDPQSTVRPASFRENGSNAVKLALVLNMAEAVKLSETSDLIDIRNKIFDKESCSILIIKDGAKGAYLFDGRKSAPIIIPVYRTNKVWTIGSGDIFTTMFAACWFNGKSALDSAHQASLATACYCNSKEIGEIRNLSFEKFNSLQIQEVPSDQVYLAGPFFTMAERWMVNEAWKAIINFGLNVFSPFHNVGLGKAKDVVTKDITGLRESKIVFAILDGLDSGTLFEVGYAVSQGKKVIVFTQNENEESLKMLVGTGCIIESDFTTALYKLYWTLADE